MKKSFHWMGLLLCSLWASFVFGATAHVGATANNANPQQLIQTVSDALLKRVVAAPKKSPSSYYFKLVEEEVAPYVDFDLIAKRVMARAYASATPDQRQRFSQTFRNTLLNTYSKAIANYGDQKIMMLPFSGIQAKGSHERATVQMEIHTKTGELIPITYALYKNDQNLWKLENIIINGVNLGLTFRNQFQDALRDKQNNLDQAIVAWQQLAKNNGSNK